MGLAGGEGKRNNEKNWGKGEVNSNLLPVLFSLPWRLWVSTLLSKLVGEL